MQWVGSGLDVGFDEVFRSVAVDAREVDDSGGFLEYHQCQQAMVDNMDY
ncbi:hypothetical protein [Catellatospora vulcania]|nr:hypothetical protein [Catellatospora vulcania]